MEGRREEEEREEGRRERRRRVEGSVIIFCSFFSVFISRSCVSMSSLLSPLIVMETVPVSTRLSFKR